MRTGRLLREQGVDRLLVVDNGSSPGDLAALRAGGSLTPEELGKLVDCDLADPGFWDGGLAIVEQQLELAETAAFEAGRLTR